jgi:hypothetical protein
LGLSNDRSRETGIGKLVIVDKEPGMATRPAHEKIVLNSIRGGGYAAVKTPMHLALTRATVSAIEEVRCRNQVSGAASPAQVDNPIDNLPHKKLPGWEDFRRQVV